MLITPAVDICIQQLGRAEEMAFTARRLNSVEIVSAAVQLYKKLHLATRIALSCGIKISPVGSFTKHVCDRQADRIRTPKTVLA